MAQSMWNPSWTDEAKIAHRESIVGVGPMLIGFTPTPFWDAWNERRGNRLVGLLRGLVQCPSQKPVEHDLDTTPHS